MACQLDHSKLLAEIQKNGQKEATCPDCDEKIENKTTYPYWKPDFDKEMKGFEVWWCPAGRIRQLSYHDVADGYRVFMILCNNRPDKTRMEVLQELKSATDGAPIELSGELFWCEEE